MEMQHGGLIIDLPEAWADRSSLLFVAPRPRETLPTPLSVSSPTEAVAVSFLVTDSKEPTELLEEQAAQLAAADDTFEVVENRPFQCGLGNGACQIQRITIGQTRIRQLSTACVVGNLAILATASAEEHRFAQCEDQLLTILESLRAKKTTTGTP